MEKHISNKNFNCMKRISLFVLLITITLAASAQQRLRINGYANYVFDDSYDSYYDPYNYYNGKINGGFQGGLGLEYILQSRYCVEIMWLHQSTHASTYYWDGATSLHEKYVNFESNIDYLLIGGD